MNNKLTYKDIEILSTCWEYSTERWIKIEAGYLRATDDRCDYEPFKDSMATWIESKREN